MSFTQLSGRKSVILLVAGLVTFILYLRFFVGFDGLLDLFSRINLFQYSLYYSIAIFALLLSILFDSMAWNSLLKVLSVKIGLRKVLLFNWIGNFTELVLPCQTVCGEVTRIYLTHKKSGDDVGTTAASVVTARILNTVVTLFGLVLGSTALILSRQMPLYLVSTLVSVSIGTTAVIVIMLYLALKEGAAEQLVNILVQLARVITKNRVNMANRKEKIHQSFSSFSQGFKTYKEQPKSLVKPLLYTIASWLSVLVVYLMVFYALDFRAISLIDVGMVYSITMTVETVTAGFPVGAVEITMINLYSLYGVPVVIAGAATTMTRVLTFWLQVMVGYPIVQWVGIKVGIKNPVMENSEELETSEIISLDQLQS